MTIQAPNIFHIATKACWPVKKERFRTGSYNEIDISKHDNWTKDKIAQRGKKMLKFLESKINGLSFTDTEIEKILFYDDFIIDKIYDRSPATNNVPAQ